MTGVSDALVERMVALVRDLHADHLKYDMHDRAQDFCQRTAAIVAELPAPVDPDLLDAREIVVAVDGGRNPSWSHQVAQGERDCHTEVCVALAAIKRGRELQEQGK